jgi:hypothetical protein
VLQRRPNTFAQTNLLPHFSLATKRRTIHSGLPNILPERLWYGQVRERLPVTAKWGEPEPKAGICRGK